MRWAASLLTRTSLTCSIGHAEIEPEIEAEIELLPRVHLGEVDL
jgi:hypothetical protein